MGFGNDDSDENATPGGAPGPVSQDSGRTTGSVEPTVAVGPEGEGARQAQVFAPTAGPLSRGADGGSTSPAAVTALVLSPHRAGLGRFLPADEDLPPPAFLPTRVHVSGPPDVDAPAAPMGSTPGSPFRIIQGGAPAGGAAGEAPRITAPAIMQVKDEATGLIRKERAGRRIVEMPLTRRGSTAVIEAISDLRGINYLTTRSNELIKVEISSVDQEPILVFVTKGRLAVEMTDASLFTRSARVEVWPPPPEKVTASKKTKDGIASVERLVEYVEVPETDKVRRRVTITRRCAGKPDEITIEESDALDPNEALDAGEIKLEEPPDWLISAVYGYGHYSQFLPVLDGIRQVPIVRGDLTLHALPGYDKTSRMIYMPHRLGQVLPVAFDQATAKKVAEILLDDLTSDFPMNDQQRAAWLASVLTLAMRPALPTAPMFLLDANVAGSGKTKLAQLAGLISIGRLPSLVTFRSDSVEFEKTLVASLMETPPALILDNLPEGMKVPGGTLDALLTSEDQAMIRELGKGRATPVSTKLGIFITGNNLQLGGDLRRRTVHIRLDSPVEQPELRTGWKHEDLIGYAKEKRLVFLNAVFSLIESYRVAGMPISNLALAGSFGEWDRYVRNLILWLGLPDPYNREELNAKDETIGFFSWFLKLLREKDHKQPRGAQGYTARQLHTAPWAAEAMEEMSSGRGPMTINMLSRVLTKYEHRMFDGLCLQKRIGHSHQFYWQAVTLEERGEK